MRTTITIDDDVAALLKELEKQRHLKPKTIINLALREGLMHLQADKRKPSARFTTKTVTLGECLVGDLDNVAEILAIAEGENFR